MSNDSNKPKSKSKEKAKVVLKVSETKPKPRKGRVVMNLKQNVNLKNGSKRRNGD